MIWKDICPPVFTAALLTTAKICCCHVWLFAAPRTVACQPSLCFINSRSLLKFMSIELVMPSHHLILCRPLFRLPSTFPSIRGFYNVSALHVRWPKCWSFSFSVSPSSEYSGLISFRTDTGLIFLSKGLSRVFSSTTVRSHQFFSAQPSLWFTFLNNYWKNHSFD